MGLTLGGRGVALSGWDAVRLDGLGPVEPPSGDVLVLVHSGRSRTVGGVHIRLSDRPLRPRWASLPSGERALLASPARAVSDTALLMRNVSAVRSLVTSSVQRRRCTVEQLVAEYHHGPRRGSAPLRHALGDLVTGARSVAEIDALRALRRCRRVPAPFEVNGSILNGAGNTVAVADFVWRHLRAVVEIDSREFHFSEADWKATMARHNRLTALGYAVAHYAPSEIRRRPAAWANEVAAWLSARAIELGA